MLLHEAPTFIFLAEEHQLILDDCFDLFLRILLLVFLGSDGLVLVLWWRHGV
jgi:hypothetical protein